MKRWLFALVALFVLGAAACGGGTEPSAETEPLPSASAAEPPAPSAAAPTAAPQIQAPSAAEESSAAPSQGGSFRRLWSDPPTLDPHLTGDTTSAGIVVEVFSGLVALSTDLQLIPDIAERWDVDDTAGLSTPSVCARTSSSTTVTL